MYERYCALDRVTVSGLEAGKGQSTFKKTKEAFVLDMERVNGKMTGNVKYTWKDVQFIGRSLYVRSQFIYNFYI